MKPRRTPFSKTVFSLSGGTEDNDLWVERTTIDDEPAILSVWELDDEERAQVAAGANIELCVWGTGTPPVSLVVTTKALGKGDGEL